MYNQQFPKSNMDNVKKMTINIDTIKKKINLSLNPKVYLEKLNIGLY